MTLARRRHNSLAVLDRSVALHGEDEQDITLQPRLDELLAEFAPTDETAPPTEVAVGWYFCVPASFRAALDIRQTPRIVETKPVLKWTQGSWFHFEEGDTIYDSVKAYLPWNLQNIHICLDIRRASPAKPVGKMNPKRYPGTVIFDVLTPNAEHTQLVKRTQTVMSQDEFIHLLIVGPPADWAFEMSSLA